MRYDIVMWKDGRHSVAHGPSIPGAYGVGAIASSAQRDLGEAVALWMSYLADIGEPEPRPLRLRVGALDGS